MAEAGSRLGRPKRGAVIDLGSNALRLQIVECVEGAEPVVLTRHRAPVRLGKDVYAQGRIGPETLEAAEAALRRFADLCEQYGVQRIRAVATAALRESSNRDEVVERLSAASPVPIEVISGTEEAWLLARAVETRVDLAHGRSLLLDLGGGSVEAILVEDGRAVAADSYPLGAIRLLEVARRQAGSAHGATFKALLEQHAGACDHTIAERMAACPLDRLVACGGSVEVLATPRIVAWVEAAAVAAVADVLEEGSTTVGIRIDLAHKAPAPVGAEVTSGTTVDAVEGRAITFVVTAFADGVELAQGEHTRVMVDEARFGG